MIGTNLKKRFQILISAAIISVLLMAEAALAVPQIMSAERGGVVYIAEGAKLVIPPKALKEDIIVSAYMVENKNAVVFYFEPDGIKFSKPVELCISWEFIESLGLEDLTLYSEDGKKIKPKTTKEELVYSIKHFSLYYYRRR